MIFFLLISRTVLCHVDDFSRYKRGYVIIWSILICLGTPMSFDVKNIDNVNLIEELLSVSQAASHLGWERFIVFR